MRTNATWTVTNQPTLFNIRMKDTYGNWGPLFKKTIFPYGANPNAELIAEGSSMSVCPNTNVTLSYNGPNGYSPTWFNGSTSASITFPVTSVGYYGVTATLGNSTYIDSIYIDFLPAPTPAVSPSGSILVCGSSAITLTTPVTANTTYQWFYNGSIISGATSSNYLPSQAGNYYVAATSSLNGCIGNSDTTNLFTVATITPNGSISSCTSPVLLSAPTGTGNAYQWKLNGVNIGGATSSTYNATTSGNYSVIVTNGSCTSTSLETNLTINPAPTTPTITAGGTTTFCDGGSVVLTSSSATGNTWSTGATTQSITVTQGGNYSVSVSNGTCSATSLVTAVTVNPVPATPTITAGGTTTFCDGGSVVLTSSSATGNTWSNGVTSQSISVSTAGTYTVTVSNGTCIATSSPLAVVVNAIPTAPTITPIGNTTFCLGDSVLLVSSMLNGSLWSNSANSQSIYVTQSGLYTVQFTDNNGCTAISLPTIINVLPLPQVTIAASGPLSICQGESLTLTSSPASSYFWSNGEITQAISVNQAGLYSVSVVGSNGCSNSSSQTTVIVNNNSTSTLNETALDSYTLNGQTYTQSGTYTQVIPNATGCDSTITLNLILSFTGIDNISEDFIKVYPNPTIDNFIVEGHFKNNPHFELIDAIGRKVLSGSLTKGINQIDLVNFSRGTYNLLIQGHEIPIRVIKN